MKKQKSLSSFLLLVLFITGTISQHIHKCKHDQIMKGYKPIKARISNFERHFRQSMRQDAAPIRVTVDSSNLKSTGKERDLILTVMDFAISFLSRRIKVLSTGRSTVLPQFLNICKGANVPFAHRSTGFYGDLVVYVTNSYEPRDNYYAWATACYQDPLTGRPIAGQVNWNTHFFSYKQEQMQSFIDVAIHELTHVLVFHNALYSEFRTSFGSQILRSQRSVTRQIIVRGNHKHAIVTPKVLEVARRYFNCPTIEGVDLEDEGTSGAISSHWERGTLHNEMMVASNLPDEAFSEFTMALLEDSGWYQVDFKIAEPLFYGRNAGCNFISQSCNSGRPNLKEYCTPGDSNICSFSLKMRGYCESDNFSNGCPFVKGYSNGHCEEPTSMQNVRGEYYGMGSRCVMGSLIHQNYQIGAESAICLKYSCENNGRTIRFHIQNGGRDIVCNTPGQRVHASRPYKGTIVCPEPSLYCSPAYVGCLNRCSQKGYCNDGLCECQSGWGGNDCSIKDGPPPRRTTFISGSTGGGSSTPRDPCTDVICPPNSSCRQGSCFCNPGFTGSKCDQRQAVCPNNCSGKGTCINNACVCRLGFVGNDCSMSSTNAGQGDNPCQGVRCPTNSQCVTGRCICNPGYSGPNCQPQQQQQNCPNNCSGQGACINSACVCKPGFIGADCATSASTTGSPGDPCKNIVCIPNSSCSGGKCFCDQGFSGPNCQPQNQRRCPNNCSGKGTCFNSACVCKPGFIGEDCSISSSTTPGTGGTSDPCTGVICPQNSQCSRGRCICNQGYSGPTCQPQQAQSCPNNCSGKGTCINAACVCKPGYVGVDCSTSSSTIPSTGGQATTDSCQGMICPQNSQCSKGNCICNPGFSGPTCKPQAQGCPNNCSGKGTCINSACVCKPGFIGADCSTSSTTVPGNQGPTTNNNCPNNCSGQGTCSNNTCKCNHGYVGEDCSIKITSGSGPSNSDDCSGVICPQNSNCVQGFCECKPGFTAIEGNCVKGCPNNCSGNGACINSACICKPSFIGEDCSSPLSTSSAPISGGSTAAGTDLCVSVICPKNSQCSKGTCVCSPGFKGPNCLPDQQNGCPNNCSGKGTCIKSACVCKPGFIGADCSGFSTIVQGGDEGSNTFNEACKDVICPENSVCEDGSCVCLPGFSVSGTQCIKDCPNKCSGNGSCSSSGKCECFHGYVGEDCSVKITSFAGPTYLERNCNEVSCPPHSKCEKGVCKCLPGFTKSGQDCVKTCPKNCSGNGTCKEGRCDCYHGFFGEDCAVKITSIVATDEKCKGIICPSSSTCDGGKCRCLEGFILEGESCVKTCPKNCSGQGVCSNKGECKCNHGYLGQDCSIVITSIKGPDQSEKDCKQIECPLNSICVKGTCECLSGFSKLGADCTKACPNNCSGRGTCSNGKCQCEKEYTGDDCSKSSKTIGCLNNCSGNGECSKNGKCVCEEGFRGADCAVKIITVRESKQDINPCETVKCPPNSKCERGNCECLKGFQKIGTICNAVCSNNCLGRGVCIEPEICKCEIGFSGADCAIINPTGGIKQVTEQTCPKSPCPENSFCDRGVCKCLRGYSSMGMKCVKSCLNNCSGTGSCSSEGVCICNPGYSGRDCSLKTIFNGMRPVPNQNISSAAIKNQSKGSKEPEASTKKTKSSETGCNDRGQFYDGACLCLEGFSGIECEEVTPGFSGNCPDNCFEDLERGECALNNIGDVKKYSCQCRPGFAEPNCGVGAAPAGSSCKENCGNKGKCENGVCICDDWYTGSDCSKAGCIGWCNSKGACVLKNNRVTQNGEEKIVKSFVCQCNDGRESSNCLPKWPIK